MKCLQVYVQAQLLMVMLIIPKDTKIELELITPISSRRSKEGNTFRLKNTGKSSYQ